MKQENYFDEYELKIRNKIMSQTLSIVYILIVINMVICEFYREDWAPVTTQCIIILFLSTTFFITMATVKNVYITRKVSYNSKGMGILYLVAGAMNLFAFISRLSTYGVEGFINDGKLTDETTMVFTMIYFIYSGLLITIFGIVRKNKSTDIDET